MGDAATMKPKFLPDVALMGRDDSGGMEYEPYTAQFGDGGKVTGAKAHLSVSGGSDDAKTGDELSDGPPAGGLTNTGRGVGDSKRTPK